MHQGAFTANWGSASVVVFSFHALNSLNAHFQHTVIYSLTILHRYELRGRSPRANQRHLPCFGLEREDDMDTSCSPRKGNVIRGHWLVELMSSKSCNARIDNLHWRSWVLSFPKPTDFSKPKGASDPLQLRATPRRSQALIKIWWMQLRRPIIMQIDVWWLLDTWDVQCSCSTQAVQRACRRPKKRRCHCLGWLQQNWQFGAVSTLKMRSRVQTLMAIRVVHKPY